MDQVRIYMPPKAQEVLSKKCRYLILYGGRGSGKSFAVANHLLTEVLSSQQRVLCAREIQSSIKDSVHRLLCDRIYELGLSPFFNIYNDSITCTITNSDFIFKGLRMNISEIKSLQGVSRVWIEEAEKVTQESWETLTPTIREEGSQIIVTFNPDDEQGATYQRFVVNPRDDVACAWLNYSDNEYFPEVLRREMEWDKINDVEKYQHIWEGYPRKYGQAVIFKKKLRIEEFSAPEGVQFRYGSDWGYGPDPTCLVRTFVYERKLFIDYSCYGYGFEIDDLPRHFAEVPGSSLWKIKGDSHRPDTISYLQRHGYPLCEAAIKGPDSVKDGIEFLQNFEAIIIHPRNKGVIDDFENYRWKEDKQTDAILPVPVDKKNHACDATRYAIEDLMRNNVSIYDVL